MHRFVYPLSKRKPIHSCVPQISCCVDSVSISGVHSDQLHHKFGFTVEILPHCRKMAYLNTFVKRAAAGSRWPSLYNTAAARLAGKAPFVATSPIPHDRRTWEGNPVLTS